MSTDFTLRRTSRGQPDEVDLANMSNVRADGLRSLTELVGRHYGLPSGILDRDYNPSHDYYVSEAEFCSLVEAVFADPVDLLTGWARYAAGMYDMAKGECHHWGWGTITSPGVPFSALHFCVPSPDRTSDFWIGPRLENEENNFTFNVGDAIAYRMERRRAELFIALAEFAIGEVNAKAREANAVKINTGTGLVNVTAAECQVEEEAFCLLVEQVVYRSFDWLCPWAQIAAAMYETIKGKWYNWIWEPRSSPTLGFAPIRQSIIPTLKPSGETVACKFWGAWQERARQGEV